MRGIQFLVDDRGQKTSVLIDLKEHGELWEDFYDTLLAKARANEPRESLDSVRSNRSPDKGSSSSIFPIVDQQTWVNGYRENETKIVTIIGEVI